MTAATSRLAALAGTLALAAFLGWPPTAGAMVAVAPLGAVLAAGLLRQRYWAIGAAIVMLPYFSWGVMEILTNPGGRVSAVTFSALTIAIFLAALDYHRRR